MTQIDSHMHLVYSHNFYYDFAIVSYQMADYTVTYTRMHMYNPHRCPCIHICTLYKSTTM